MKKRKQALFQSVISLLLCFSMLVGTTFAWFTDSVATGMNTIAAGNLDVEIFHTNAAVTDQRVDSATKLFLDLQGNPILWEPGVVSYENLRVANEGDLALAYQLLINTAGENHVLDPESGAKYGLSQILKVGVVENGITATDRDGVVASVEDANWTTLADFIRSGSLLPEGAGESEKTWGIVIYWEPGEDDNRWNLNNGKELDQGEYLMIDLGIRLVATQEQFESDSFGSDYDANAKADVFPEFAGGTASSPVESDGNGGTAAEVTMSSGAVSATVPAGAKLAEGAKELTLSVAPMSASGANITLSDNEAMRSLDVHIEGLAADNTVPVTVTLTEAAPKGLNMGNYKLYHVEDGATVEMILVDSAADFTAHNQFKYDPATGDIVLYMATFSEVALVADTVNAWNGTFSYDWYTNSNARSASEYVIANADELAGFGAIVGGMDGQTKDSFSGKTVKLISDINLGDKESGNNPDLIFYPIGYYNSTRSYEKFSGSSVTSSVSSFEGTFDGQGHTISNFYQNTWEMFGDYNDGYSGTPNHYKDAMGLFGYVYGGTIKNLTVDNFSSDGEFTPTGVIAAYAANSTFENIAITNCNPRVYNTGNGGIVGIGGNSDDPDTYKLTFTNITIDNSNKISALWGSWDVACGGLVGMFRGAGHVYMTNCHVAAQIDVYNDVCGNYQYYWYRYAGMLVGTNKNMITDTNGYTVPETDKFHAENCTVHFGDWNDYYYCELVANSLASYTHDHQFSRLTQIQNVSDIQDANGNWSTSGNFILMNRKTPTEICYHIMKDASGNLYEHKHDVADATNPNVTETVNGETVLKENNQRIFLPFNQLFTGYGWGVKHIPIYDDGTQNPFSGVTVLGREVADSVEKFETKFTGNFLYRVGNQNTVNVGSLFKYKDNIAVEDQNGSGVVVTIDNYEKDANVGGTFKADTSDWTKGTIQFSGTGLVKITIQDYNYCTPTELIVEVVDAKNATAYSDLTNTSCVMLNNIDMPSNGKYSLYDYQTLYGNGFTFNVVAGRDHDTAGGYVGGNGTVWVRNSILDNVIIVGEVYTKYGGTVKSEYNFPTVLVLGNSTIANCYISNGSSPVRVGSGCNVEIINTTLEGGNFANLDIRGGSVKLRDVITINQTDAAGNSISNNKGVVGLGIVVQMGSTVTIDIDGLTQYNNISKETVFTATEANTLKNTIFGKEYQAYQFSYNNADWVNTGIVSMVAEVNTENFTKMDGYIAKDDATIAGYDGCVYAPNPGKVDNPGEYVTAGQYAIAPAYKFDYTTKNNVPKQEGSNESCVYDDVNGEFNISFSEGDSFKWDADILEVKKDGHILNFEFFVSDGATVNADKTITFSETGVYTVTYRYIDPYNYMLSGGEVVNYEAVHEKTVKIVVREVVETTAKTTFAFGNNGFKTVKVGTDTYVMPNVDDKTDATAYDIVSGVKNNGIGRTTVNGEVILYPLVEMHKSGSSNWYNYFSVFEAVTITDLNGTTHNTNSTALPAGSDGKLDVIGGFVLDSSRAISTKEKANGTSIFDYDTGKEIKCSTYSSYGLCYYPDSQFTKNGTSDRAERTIVVKYRYTDSNNNVYFYYIGYWCAEHTKECVTPDTLITLADGSQVRVDSLTGKENLLVWNLETGKYDAAPIVFVDTEEEMEYEIIHLYFSDGSDVKVISEHGFFDLDLGEYVYIDAANYADYIGHRFVTEGSIKSNDWNVVTLKDVVLEKEVTTAWSPVTFEHLCYYTNGVLSMPGGISGLFNIFEVDTDLMRYDAAQMEKDIETYGLFTIEDFGGMITQDAFDAFNGAYLMVAMGKGLLTWEDIAYMAERYIPLM